MTILSPLRAWRVWTEAGEVKISWAAPTTANISTAMPT